MPVRRAAAVDCPADPPRSWLILPFETPSSTAASPTESCAAKRRRSWEGGGDLSGGALARGGGRAACGPLVKDRVAGVVVHLQVQDRLSAARKILDHADDLADVRSRTRRVFAQVCVPGSAGTPAIHPSPSRVTTT